MLDITIGNPTPHEVKDIEIWCVTYGASGTKIGEVRQRVYESAKRYRTTEIKQLNMGLIHPQTASVGCVISDLILVPQN
jgi:hypothetical protein